MSGLNQLYLHGRCIIRKRHVTRFHVDGIKRALREIAIDLLHTALLLWAVVTIYLTCWILGGE